MIEKRNDSGHSPLIVLAPIASRARGKRLETSQARQRRLKKQMRLLWYHPPTADFCNY
jgi:hypothetical protein